MAVRKFRSVEEMPEPPRAASALEGPTAACELAELAAAFGHRWRLPRGVRKFHSVEEADAARQAWEAQALRAGRPPDSTQPPRPD